MTRFTNPLDVPLAGEASAALAHGGRRLRKALDALHGFDEANTHASNTERTALLAEAGDALWCYVVHREILGLMDVDYILREYRVPEDVRKAMGPRHQARSDCTVVAYDPGTAPASPCANHH